MQLQVGVVKAWIISFWHVKIFRPTLIRSYNLFAEIPNAAFFFSAISTQEKSKASVNEETDEESEENLSSQVPSTISEHWFEGSPVVVNKSLCPAISYWLALTTPNGAPANPIVVHRALLQCGVNVSASQVCIYIPHS